MKEDARWIGSASFASKVIFDYVAMVVSSFHRALNTLI